MKRSEYEQHYREDRRRKGLCRCGNPLKSKANCAACLKRRQDNARLRKTGCSPERYAELFREQNGRCAICRKRCPTGRQLAADHDHRTKIVRGLLCMRCNAGIGQLGDNPDRLLCAAIYLAPILKLPVEKVRHMVRRALKTD